MTKYVLIRRKAGTDEPFEHVEESTDERTLHDRVKRDSGTRFTGHRINRPDRQFDYEIVTAEKWKEMQQDGRTNTRPVYLLAANTNDALRVIDAVNAANAGDSRHEGVLPALRAARVGEEVELVDGYGETVEVKCIRKTEYDAHEEGTRALQIFVPRGSDDTDADVSTTVLKRVNAADDEATESTYALGYVREHQPHVAGLIDDGADVVKIVDYEHAVEVTFEAYRDDSA